MIRLSKPHFDKQQKEKPLKVFISFSDKKDMNSPDFFYVIKNVLLSPIVIGITIVCGLLLNFIFYVVSYRKKPRPIITKNTTIQPVKETTPSPEEETEEEEEEIQ